MFHLGTENPWFFAYGFNMFVDFCMWVLEVDGLQVPPFDQHPAGDRTLQAIGLDADGWRSWVNEVVNLQHQQTRAVRQPFVAFTNEWWQSMQAQGMAPLNPQSETFRQQAEALGEQFKAAQGSRPDLFFPKLGDAQNPPGAWKGSAVVGQRLGELWEEYKPLSNKRKEWQRALVRQWSTGRGDGTVKRVWDDLEPYHTRLETLAIHLVEYPGEVYYLVPPVSVIMTVVNGHLDGETFRTNAFRAAEELATRNSF
jgi:hypothetical protein